MTDEIKDEAESNEDRQKRIEYQLRMLTMMAGIALPGLNVTIVAYGNGALAASSTGACTACLRDALMYVASVNKDAVHLTEENVEGETRH